MESLSWSLSWCPPRPTAPTTLPWPPCRTRCRRKSPGAALNSPESAKMTAIAPLITTPTPRSDPSLKHMPVWSLNHRLYITGCISFFLFFSPSVTHVCHRFFFSFFWYVFFLCLEMWCHYVHWLLPRFLSWQVLCRICIYTVHCHRIDWIFLLPILMY